MKPSFMNSSTNIDSSHDDSIKLKNLRRMSAIVKREIFEDN
jgi:hypothetical protein